MYIKFLGKNFNNANIVKIQFRYNNTEMNLLHTQLNIFFFLYRVGEIYLFVRQVIFSSDDLYIPNIL